MGRHVLKPRAFALLIGGLAALALPATAGANLDDGGGQWAPGRALIKFDAASMGKHDHIPPEELTHEIGSFLARDKALRIRIVAKLPVVPNAYLIAITGNVRPSPEEPEEPIPVPAGLETLVRLDRHEHSLPWIRWAQPDYRARLQENAGPNDPSYWPANPYFWPRTWANQNACQGNQLAMGQLNLWPLYRDLRDPSGPWARNNPTPRDVRPGLNYRQIAASSIDVLPVWDALGHHTAGRHGPGGQSWSAGDLERSGIGIWDSGIANNPSVAGQVAAIVGVGNSMETLRGNPAAAPAAMTIAYQDDPQRHSDLNAIKQEFGHHDGGPPSGVEPAELYRPLFPVDDLGVGTESNPNPAPDGCDGHGTEVASVAAAAAGPPRPGQGQGIAGVGWNVPLVGIRPWRLYDFPEAQTVAQALREANAAPVGVFDDTLIDQLAVAKALKLPVLNMSFGEQLFATRDVIAKSAQGREREETLLLVEHPAVVEALGRAFTGESMLGVTSAGRGRYGLGGGVDASFGPGASDAAQAPCGLRLLRDRGSVLLGATETEQGPPGARRRVPSGLVQRFSVPGVDFSALNLLCVTSSLGTKPALAPDSGSGDAAVDLAAPATDIPVATRPGGSGDPSTWYRRASGTSFAAAEVSGAAALLREVAPHAGMRVIARALRLGARSAPAMLTRVRYGLLDVTCAALWLVRHPQAAGQVTITEQALGDEAQHCFRPVIQTKIDEWDLPKSWFDPSSTFLGRPRREDNGRLLSNVFLAVAGNPQTGIFDTTEQASDAALTLQDSSLLPEGSAWDRNRIAFFPMTRSGLSTPVAPPDRPIYNFNQQSALKLFGWNVACPAGTELVDFSLRIKSSIVKGYFWASSDLGDKLAANVVPVQFGLVKPFFSSFVSDPIRVVQSRSCAVPAPDGG